MRQEWEPEDLIEVWTLLEEDQERLRNKSGANRLGFALLLKFFEVEARFPEDAGEIPVPAMSYVAQQVKVPAEEWAAYDWSGRAIKRHRMEIRGAFGFRECTAEEDQAQLAEWPAVELCGVELNRDRLAEAVVARCRKERLEPPAPGQIARLVGKAVNTFEERFCAATVGRLSAATRSRLDDLIAEDASADEESAGGGGTFFTELKADPGALGLDSLLAEVNKLQGVRGLQLPPLALRLLQSALVHVNTLLLQDILSEEKWQKRLTNADRRALSPLFWTHVNPYGRFELDMNSHLDLAAAAAAMVPGPRTAPVAEAAQRPDG